MRTGTLTVPIATVVQRSSDLDRGGPLARRANTASQPLTRSGGAVLRPQICGALSKRGCKKIERRIIRNYCRLFNEFFPWALRLTLDAECAGERKLARLRRRFGL